MTEVNREAISVMGQENRELIVVDPFLFNDDGTGRGLAILVDSILNNFPEGVDGSAEKAKAVVVFAAMAVFKYGLQGVLAEVTLMGLLNNREHIQRIIENIGE